MRALLPVVAAGLWFFGHEGSVLAADKCFPACRPGFVCSPDGTCLSECNPPCSGNETCMAGGACKSNGIATRSTDAPPPSADSLVAEQRGAAIMVGPVALFGGPLRTNFGVTATLQFKTSGDHSLVAGPRLAMYFPSKLAYTDIFGTIGFDVGYRGNFVKDNSVGAGVLVMMMPSAALGLYQVSTASSVPFTVGAVLHVKKIEVQATLGGGPMFSFGTSGGSAEVLGFGTFLLNGGYVF